jgi:hypothetical protein
LVSIRHDCCEASPPDKRYCFTRPGQLDTRQVFRDFVDEAFTLQDKFIHCYRSHEDFLAAKVSRFRRSALGVD